MKPLIEAKNLDFIYNRGKANEFHALINISFNIYPEEYVIIYGPSGCGKSTLLNVIAGLEKPDSGTMTVNDRDMMAMDKNEFAEYHRSEIGMVFQQYNLIMSLTVLDNVALPQMFLNADKKIRDEVGMKLLKRFGIDNHATKIPTELSGGQQQRIGIARAIVNDPKIVLADEPMGNLDSVSAGEALIIFKELNEKEKKTLIMVTHNPENLDQGDRIIYMRDGMIEREVINKNKTGIKKKVTPPKAPSTEIKDIMRSYQGLTPEQLNVLIMPFKAKVFAHHFITNRNMEETRIFEDIMQRRLIGSISREEFFDTLTGSFDKGGIGFDKRTANKILRKADRTIRMAYSSSQKRHQKPDENGKHAPVTEEEKTEIMSTYLLKTCYTKSYKNLNENQLTKFKGAVKERMESKLTKAKFYQFLDDPEKKGGVGLNIKTAKAITEELELVLIIGFGVSQGKKIAEIKSKNIAPSKNLPKSPHKPEEKIKKADEKKTQAKESSEKKPAAPKKVPEKTKEEQELKNLEEAKREGHRVKEITALKEELSNHLLKPEPVKKQKAEKKQKSVEKVKELSPEEIEAEKLRVKEIAALKEELAKYKTGSLQAVATKEEIKKLENKN